MSQPILSTLAVKRTLKAEAWSPCVTLPPPGEEELLCEDTSF